MTTTNAVTILFAEDDPFLRELIAAHLRANRFRVIEAESGDQALPMLRDGDIDVLLTDICMPGNVDGWALAEQARISDPDIAVLYASSGRQGNAARQVSGSLYVRKPYRPDEIIAPIRELTSLRSASRRCSTGE